MKVSIQISLENGSDVEAFSMDDGGICVEVIDKNDNVMESIFVPKTDVGPMYDVLVAQAAMMKLIHRYTNLETCVCGEGEIHRPMCPMYE